MRKFLIVLAVIALVTGFIAYTLTVFSSSFYEHYQIAHVEPDAVIVLTGGKGRLSSALALFKEADAKFLFILGVSKTAALESIFSQGELSGVKTENIVLDKASQTTYENALYAKDYLDERTVESVVLVTSNYHMKRALFIFESVLPANINIIPYAIGSENFQLNDWWLHPKSLKLAFAEYLKYGWFKLTLQLFHFFNAQ